MAANRTVPDEDSNPSGVTGVAYADNVRDEIEALWNGVITPCGTVGGTANAITAVCAPVLIADPVNGQTFRLIPTANNTNTVTINLDARGAIALKDEDGGALGADDLVSGRAIMFFYHSASGFYRLMNPTTQALLDSLASEIAAATSWDLIGDTLVGSAVANIEHTFTANDYIKICMFISGVSPTSNTVAPVATLRNASGAIVTLTHATGDVNVADFLSNEAQFMLDVVSATKVHNGAWTRLLGASTGGSSATAPDRVRFAWSSGNIDAGRVITYGLRA